MHVVILCINVYLATLGILKHVTQWCFRYHHITGVCLRLLSMDAKMAYLTHKDKHQEMTYGRRNKKPWM